MTTTDDPSGTAGTATAADGPSEALQALATAMRALRTPEAPEPSVQAQRESMAASMQQLAENAVSSDAEVTDSHADGVPVRWTVAPRAARDRVLLYFHGGGYVLGSLDTHQDLMARLANGTGWSVLGVDYRLAPEHPWPAAVDDAVAVYRWLRAEQPEARIALAGDSAGGGLALALMQRLAAQGLPQPVAAVLFSPWTDLTASLDSHRSRAEVDPMVSGTVLRRLAAHYVAGADATHPEISPLFGDLTGLPPLLIQVGDDEVLLDDARELGRRAAAAGVTVSQRVWPGAFHVFQIVPQLPETAAALGDVARFLAAVDTASPEAL
jgi:monoterpene epsilon-lactone hydrolase